MTGTIDTVWQTLESWVEFPPNFFIHAEDSPGFRTTFTGFSNLPAIIRVKKQNKRIDQEKGD